MKNILCCWCAALMLVLLDSAQAQVQAQDAVDASELLLQATGAYKDGDYSKAVVLYERIAGAGNRNGKLYYNLANAYMRAGRPGRALVNYRRAELRMPRDEALRSNIRYTLSQARDNITCQGYAETLRDLCFWYTRMSAAEIFWTALALNAVFWLLLLARFFYRREGLSIILGIFFFLAIVFGVSAAVKHYSVACKPRGVIVVSEALVRSGTSLNDTVLFKLHEAAECVLEEERGQWARIRLCDGKQGWVQAASIAKVD